MTKPITPIIAVDAIILYKDNYIVLIRRRNPPFKGEYALPGGFVDVGETLEKACIREAKEETNIAIKVIELIGVFSDPNRDPRGHTVSITYLCEPKNYIDKPKGLDDASHIELIPLNKLSTIDLAFDHKKILKEAGFID
ncbi:MAG: NUDIX hydrolase [Candidatus Lokiarchaeota archaeon]|nr:NUDIX hydrolase [Candidatus Lokiarchaeota archaeon]